jgi:RHS repeat-associated protein
MIATRRVFLTQNDRHIYGSSRLGMDTRSVELIASFFVSPSADGTIHTTNADDRVYELTNHLGNVLATFTARKLPLAANGVFTGFSPHVTSLTDYYAFGSGMEGRTVTNNYRYGFNAMEREDDLYAPGSAYDFGARMYDGRLGRWWSVDIMQKLHAGWTTYKFGLDNPILFVDPNGETEYYFNGKWIGSDGVDNRLVGIVNDKHVKRKILRETRKGLLQQPTSTLKPIETTSTGTLLIHQDIFVEAYEVYNNQMTDTRGEQGEFYSFLNESSAGYKSVAKGVSDFAGADNIQADGASISIHGHPVGLKDGAAYSASEVSEEDYEVFKKMEFNIIVGKNGKDAGYIFERDMNGQPYQTDRVNDNRKGAINIFDRSGAPLSSISGKVASKTSESLTKSSRRQNRFKARQNEN